MDWSFPIVNSSHSADSREEQAAMKKDHTPVKSSAAADCAMVPQIPIKLLMCDN